MAAALEPDCWNPQPQDVLRVGRDGLELAWRLLYHAVRAACVCLCFGFW